MCHWRERCRRHGPSLGELAIGVARRALPSLSAAGGAVPYFPARRKIAA
jgi:hypothetical protein